MYLAIDTSTDTAGLAIICDGIILSQESWCCRQNHSVELLPRLARMLQSLQLEAKDLRGIIAARGPGSQGFGFQPGYTHRRHQHFGS
jgi:tRNA threonylcarbamoyladenosine biosynthesis protein TsaB